MKTLKEKIHSRTCSFTLNFTSGVVFTFICTLASLVGAYIVSNYTKPQWVNEIRSNKGAILLLGSGTVYEYLKKQGVTNCEYIKNIPVPTYFAIKALREEHMPEIGKDNTIHSPINPIFMAAALPHDSVVMSGIEKDKFLKEIGKIISVYLGESKLKVIIYPRQEARKFVENDKYIKLNELKELLIRSKEFGFKVFRTSQNSSTRDLFQNLMEYDIPESESCFFDMQSENLDFINSNTPKLIILCNEYYKPSNIPQKDSKEYFVIKENDKSHIRNAISMPLFLYFTGYKKLVNDKEYFIIPEDIKRFVKSLRQNFNVEIKNDNSPNLIIKDPSYSSLGIHNDE